MGGVGGRTALCLGWTRGAVRIHPGRATKEDQARGKFLPYPLGNGGPLKVLS